MNSNFKLNKKNIGEHVELKGWVNKSRRLGELIFLDIRNGQDIVQVLVDSKSPVYKIANELRNEFVISIKGKVEARKNSNKEMFSGDIEIKALEIFIINKAEQTPMLIKDETDALEQKRSEYRYLDLRRANNQQTLRTRSDFNRIIREYFYNNEFIEVETPIITKPTPGGAGEFKVISDKNKNNYSLVQSPQIYKQLLMYGGFDKYFQIARCFRDEDSRKDRQLEFTQLDIEMSFVTRDEIIEIINKLLMIISSKFTTHKTHKIPVITYVDAMNQYGSDKPDIRFENKIFDLTSTLKNTSMNFINEAISKGKKVKALFFKENISSSDIKKIESEIKSQGAQGLVWSKLSKDNISGNLKSLSNIEIANIEKIMKINDDGTLFLILDDDKKALEFMGRVRIMIAEKINIIEEDKLCFVWVVDFPLFEENSNKNIESMHNPFTSIKKEDLEKFKLLKPKENKKALEILSNSYDIVLNGYEIGGGSIRISNFEEQNKIFEIIGLPQKEINSNFGWFLEAQKYGIPEHGGIALGLDRILSIILNKESIRDVIAFPKTSNGTDEMMKEKNV